MDEELLQKSFEIYLDIIQDKHWAHLTKSEIELIQDEEKRKEYKKNYKECMQHLILPLLYSMNNSSGFKFSNRDNSLTCHNMMEDIWVYYKKRGISQDEMFKIAGEKNPSKKH